MVGMGLEPIQSVLTQLCAHVIRHESHRLAEVVGFEPTNAGVKVPCLTAWLHLYGMAGRRVESHSAWVTLLRLL